MHEEHFLASWLNEDVEGRADMKEWVKKAEDEESKSGKRERRGEHCDEEKVCESDFQRCFGVVKSHG